MPSSISSKLKEGAQWAVSYVFAPGLGVLLFSRDLAIAKLFFLGSCIVGVAVLASRVTESYLKAHYWRERALLAEDKLDSYRKEFISSAPNLSQIPHL